MSNRAFSNIQAEETITNDDDWLMNKTATRLQFSINLPRSEPVCGCTCKTRKNLTRQLAIYCC